MKEFTDKDYKGITDPRCLTEIGDIKLKPKFNYEKVEKENL